MSVVLCTADDPPINVVTFEMAAEFLTGSFVMILIVPATADEPKRAEPPPLMTSTLSTMFAGSCSIPYTPANALKIGRESIRIWVYCPSRPLILTCWKPQFWQLFSTLTPGWKASPWATVVPRVKVTLVCTECKQRNYDTKKNKKNDPDRLELNKYCKFCRKHTLHKESK